jgi:hypothetical protein
MGELAARNNMIIKSTCFKHKAIHKGTWMCPGTDMVNQIDHVIINKRHASSITDVRSCRRPSCDSDHFLVKVTIRERLSNALKSKEEREKEMEFKQTEKRKKISIFISKKIHEKLEDTNGIQDVQTEWNKIKNVIVEAAKESLGEKGKINEEKFDEECRTAIQEKNNMRLNMETENGKVGRIEN